MILSSIDAEAKRPELEVGDAIRYRRIGNDIKYCPMCGRRLGDG